MAKNDVIITLRVDDKGNIKQVGQKAEKAGRQVDKLGKSATNADRNMKGLSQQSSNSSKNFSKMAQGMSGGLVPAYATLAAQIFAVTAAFRFLQQAANFRVLIEGQKEFAAETGVAYNSIAKSMQLATEGQITFADASQAAAIGMASGLTPDQLNRLAGAAKNVSIALGRDVTDSFNRLIRGTTKAEPELLDELGIILRLEEATKKYAASIGKTKETLTIFEKSQAVTNEVLEQAESKFGAIGDNIPVNALNTFAKAFDDVLNILYTFVGPIAESLATFFSKNLVAFMGALTAFAIPIVKLILPSFDAWSAAAAENAIVQQGVHEQLKGDLKTYRSELQQTATAEQAMAQKKRGAFEKTATRMGIGTSARGKKAAIDHFNRQTAAGVKVRTGKLKAESVEAVAILDKQYNAMSTSTSKFRMHASQQFGLIGKRVKVVTTKMKSMWAGTMAFMKSTASKVGKFMNKAFSILMIFSILSMVYGAIKEFLGVEDEVDPLDDVLDNAKNINAELAAMARRFNEKVGGPGTLKSALDTLKFRGNMAQSSDLLARLEQFKNLDKDEDNYDKIALGLSKSIMELSDVSPQMRSVSAGDADSLPHGNLGGFAAAVLAIADTASVLSGSGTLSQGMVKSALTDPKEIDNIIAITKQLINAGKATDQYNSAQTELIKSTNSYIQSAAKLPFGNIVQGYRKSVEAMKVTTADLEAELAILLGLGDKANENDKKRIEQISVDTRTYDDDGKVTGGSMGELGAAQSKLAVNEAGLDRYKGYTLTANKYKRALDGIAYSTALVGNRTDNLAKKERVLLSAQSMSIKILQKKLDITRLKAIADPDSEADAETRLAAKEGIKNLTAEVNLLDQKKKTLLETIDPLVMIKDASIAAFDQGLQSAIMGVIDGTKSMKEGFLEMAKAVLQAIAQIIVKLIAMKAIEAMGFGFADGGVIPMANGGIKPKGYRKGGIVTEPTYLAGEGKYNEAIVPLPDGRSIPVMMKGGSGGNANVTVNISADGNTTESMTTDGGDSGAKLGRAISSAVQEELHKQQRPGGILSPYGG